MCGIAGLYRFAGQGPLNLGAVQAMTDCLAHRGPDGEGVWLDAEAGMGLGNRRLAIVDPSPAGDQPMATQDGSVCLTYNGEVYNHVALRAELESLGHRFVSRADSEVVLHAYQEWGLDCFARFNGMWALAIWDARRRRLVLSRDRLGVKPLYYLARDGQIRFASEIKALAAVAERPLEPNLAALPLILTFLSTPAPLTPYQDVFRLPAGHLLIVDQGGEPRVQRYWDPLETTSPLVQEAARLSPERLQAFAVETIRDLLIQAVRRRMMADVPVGAFLSGGIDSNSVAALAQRESSRRLTTLTAGYSVPGYQDDLVPARHLAEQLGTDHHEVLLDEEDVIGAVDSVLYHLDEPNVIVTYVPINYLAAAARREGSLVMLCGEGSDELFGGYGIYGHAMRALNLVRSPAWRLPFNRLLPSLQRPARHLIGRFCRHPYRLIDDLERASRGETPFLTSQIACTEQTKRSLLNMDRFVAAGSGRPAAMMAGHFDRVSRHRWSIEAPEGSAIPESEAFRTISYLEMMHRIPDTLLSGLDKMTMAHGIEARVPFLDYELVEFVLALPGALRVSRNPTKQVLRQAALAWLPAEETQRPKIGFGMPIGHWLNTRLGKVVEEQVVDSLLARQGLVRVDAFRRMLRAQQNGSMHLAVQIWGLFVVCRWFDLAFSPSAVTPPPHGPTTTRAQAAAR